MKTVHVKLARKDLALAFTMDALADIEDVIKDFNISKLGEYTRNPRYLLDLLYCLAKQGEMIEGRKLEIDRAWIGSHTSPSPAQTAKIQIAVLNALTEGMRMETEDDEEEGEKDVVLEELKKNGKTED